jgi:hypothetical protein
VILGEADDVAALSSDLLLAGMTSLLERNVFLVHCFMSFVGCVTWVGRSSSGSDPVLELPATGSFGWTFIGTNRSSSRIAASLYANL